MLNTDDAYAPRTLVVVPTYNEEELIVRRLDNIFEQTYPKDRLSMIVADDGSDDRSRSLVTEWVRTHPDLETTLTPQTVHSGKMPMFRALLNRIEPNIDLVVLTDVDAIWERDAIANATRYMADPTVGSVTCSIQYVKNGNSGGESAYRNFYNVLRVCESKIFGTPVQNGPFLALRISSLREYGLPDFAGIDDSAIGSFFALAGLRAIQVDDVKVWEDFRGSLLRRKLRRANRLILNFTNTKKCACRCGVYRRTAFEKIWKMEWWLHIVNPWLLIGGILLMAIGLVAGPNSSLCAFFLLLLGAGLILPAYRSWAIQQFYLIAARIRGLITKDITWRR